MLPSKASIAPRILLLFTDIRSPGFSKLATFYLIKQQPQLAEKPIQIRKIRYRKKIKKH
jgi:hypothetical protein